MTNDSTNPGIDPDLYEKMFRWKESVQALVTTYQGRIRDDELERIRELVDANEAGIGLEYLARAIERLPDVKSQDREQILNLGGDLLDLQALPPAYSEVGRRPL
jgi:hypothetical protein